MSFHQKWVEWIMQCITSVSYSFLLNGAAQGSVKPQRGIRQGDPLSPYIFILCSEVLSGLCQKAQQNGDLLGVRVAKGSPRLKHLLFADDTMFFCKFDVQSCQNLMLILQKYERASGVCYYIFNQDTRNNKRTSNASSRHSTGGRFRQVSWIT